MASHLRFICVAFSSLLLTLSARAETITVSAAISLKESLQQIGTAYEAVSHDQVVFNFDASGKLVQQIKQGAPVDAFISADNDQMDKLAAAGKVDATTRKILVRNTLVLIVPATASSPPRSFADLASTPERRIAIGEPKTVPAGRYAMQTLKSLKLDKAVADRLVLGESVRQVLIYVEHNDVGAGIVYGTDAKQAGPMVSVVATADPSTHDAIEYPAVVIKDSPHADAAGKFLDYLRTDPARAVFTSKGFSISGPTTRPSP